MGSRATQAAIEGLYRERFRAFVLTATAVLRDGEAALDVVQEGFAIALARRKSFRGDGSLEGWVWRIVLNLARDEQRIRLRPFLPPQKPRGEEGGRDVNDLRESLLDLPERQRLAIFLRYYADLTYADIADALGVTAGTVAASLSAAHRALQRTLGEEIRLERVATGP